MTGINRQFTEDDMKRLLPDEKMGIIATRNSDDLPHISLITTIYAKTPSQIILGEFSSGESKRNMEKNPQVSFLILTPDRSTWRGKALWTHRETSGADYERLNNIPMFRYNTYFGINTVHYLDLVETTDRQRLSMTGIVTSSLLTMLSKGGVKDSSLSALSPFGIELFNGMSTLKFISYIGDDSFPVLIPVIQCQAAGPGTLSFSSLAYCDELGKIKTGSDVAVFGLNMKMESLLVRGKFNGIKRVRGIKTGAVDINWVYNSMPPAHGQIFPEIPVTAVQNF